MRWCFFIGHRDAPERIYPALCAEVERLVCQRRITEFLVGNHGAFDRMAARAVMVVREQHLQVQLTLLLSRFPRNPFTVPTGFDGSLYPEELEGVPPAMPLLANRPAGASSFHGQFCPVFVIFSDLNGNFLFLLAKPVFSFIIGSANIPI